jgi:hypothetical protein
MNELNVVIIVSTHVSNISVFEILGCFSKYATSAKDRPTNKARVKVSLGSQDQ